VTAVEQRLTFSAPADLVAWRLCEACLDVEPASIMLFEWALVQISLAGETESRRQHWIRQRAPRSKSQARFCPSLEASLTRTGLS
jgi:hypothetical protein